MSEKDKLRLSHREKRTSSEALQTPAHAKKKPAEGSTSPEVKREKDRDKDKDKPKAALTTGNPRRRSTSFESKDTSKKPVTKSDLLASKKKKDQPTKKTDKELPIPTITLPPTLELVTPASRLETSSFSDSEALAQRTFKRSSLSLDKEKVGSFSAPVTPKNDLLGYGGLRNSREGSAVVKVDHLPVIKFEPLISSSDQTDADTADNYSVLPPEPATEDDAENNYSVLAPQESHSPSALRSIPSLTASSDPEQDFYSVLPEFEQPAAVSKPPKTIPQPVGPRKVQDYYSDDTAGLYTQVELDACQLKPKAVKRSADGPMRDSSASKEDTNVKVVSKKGWNTAFQELQSLPASFEKYRGLNELGKDFISVAEAYGRIIISELFLPDDVKTVQPLSGWGVAGGFKYICQGILFKFCLDTEFTPGSWLYGKEQPLDEKAMKSASNELKGLTCLFQCQIKEIHFPLMALTHYQGYVLVASSLLPITRESLIYGSNDGGTNVKSTHRQFNDMMAEAGSLLNLDSHYVKGTEIYGPGDIEGHYSPTDGKYYLIDFGRVMPPEGRHPLLPKIGNPFFYDLFRPTFVQNYKQPLCSDALTGWCRTDPNAREKGRAVLEATKFLVEELVPRFAKLIGDGKNFILSNDDLINALHKAGINCRHLGLVRKFCPNPVIGKLILVEIVSRALKNDLRIQLRKKMQDIRQATTEPYREVAYTFLRPVIHYSESEPQYFLPYPSHDHSPRDDTFLIENTTSSPMMFVADHPVPISHNRTFFFQVHLSSGSNRLYVGFVPEQSLSQPISQMISEGYAFFLAHEGRFITGSTEHRINVLHQGEVAGFFYQPARQVLLITKNELTIGDEYQLTLRPNTKLVPVIILMEQSSLTYAFGIQKLEGAKVDFDVRELSESLGVPLPTPKRFQQSEIFWKGQVQESILLRFPSCITPSEEKIDLREKLDLRMLIHRISSIAGIQFSDAVQNYENGRYIKIQRSDVVRLLSRVSHMPSLDEAEAKMRLIEALRLKKKNQSFKVLLSSVPSLQQVATLFEKIRIKDVISSVADYYQWARVYYEIGLHHETDEKLIESLIRADMALTIYGVDTWRRKILYLKTKVFNAMKVKTKSGYVNPVSTLHELVWKSEKEEETFPQSESVEDCLKDLWKNHTAFLVKKLKKIDMVTSNCNSVNDMTSWFTEVKECLRLLPRVVRSRMVAWNGGEHEVYSVVNLIFLSVACKLLRLKKDDDSFQQAKQCVGALVKHDPNLLESYLTALFQSVVDGVLLSKLLTLCATEAIELLARVFDSTQATQKTIRVSHFPSQLADAFEMVNSAMHLQKINSGALEKLVRIHKSTVVLASEIFVYVPGSTTTSVPLTTLAKPGMPQILKITLYKKSKLDIFLRFGGSVLSSQPGDFIYSKIRQARELSSLQIEMRGWGFPSKKQQLMLPPVFPVLQEGFEGIITEVVNHSIQLGKEADLNFVERMIIFDALSCILAELHTQPQPLFIGRISDVILAVDRSLLTQVQSHDFSFTNVFLADIGLLSNSTEPYELTVTDSTEFPPESRLSPTRVKITPGPAHDIWCLGYFMDHLFKKSLRSSKAPTHLRQSSRKVSTNFLIPPRIKNLIAQCLSDEPALRPTAKHISMNRILFRESVVEVGLQEYFTELRYAFQLYQYPFTTSINSLAAVLGLFPNTIGLYLRSEKVFLSCLQKIFQTEEISTELCYSIFDLLGPPSSMQFLTSLHTLFSLPGFSGAVPEHCPLENLKKSGLFMVRRGDIWCLLSQKVDSKTLSKPKPSKTASSAATGDEIQLAPPLHPQNFYDLKKKLKQQTVPPEGQDISFWFEIFDTHAQKGTKSKSLVLVEKLTESIKEHWQKQAPILEVLRQSVGHSVKIRRTNGGNYKGDIFQVLQDSIECFDPQVSLPQKFYFREISEIKIQNAKYAEKFEQATEGKFPSDYWIYKYLTYSYS